MKQNNIQQIIEETIFNEVKRRIIQESEKEVMEVFHVTCEGQPLETFKTEEEAQQFVEKNKNKFNGKELIIDKKTYDSHEDMIDKLDEMSDMYEENKTETMENKERIYQNRTSSSDKVYKPEEKLSKSDFFGKKREKDDSEESPRQMGGKYADWDDDKKNKSEEPKEGNAFTEALIKAKDEGKDTFTVDGKEYDVKESWKELAEESLFEDSEGQCEECGDGSVMEEKGVCSKCGGELNEEGVCDECKGPMSISEEKMCSECGGQLNEEGKCNECGSSMMKESSKKKLRLRESELVSLIGKMVNEAMKGEPGVAGVPGITITKKAQDVSKKENNKNISDVESKMKNYLKIDGSDNPEFPKQNGKGDKMAIHNTSDENEYVEDTRGYGLEDLKYDHEPSENFKKRLKAALDGDTKMGNSQDAANVVKTETGKKVLNKAERKEKKEKKFPMYVKDPQPTQNVSESKVGLTTILTEEVEKMKRLTNYNKKTQ